MRLPLLPLRPTAAPGDGATPPTPAAAAAMDEAWADGEMAVVRSILANIKAGDEEGAEKLACDAVANLLSTNGWIHRLGAEDAIWANPSLTPLVSSSSPRPRCTARPISVTLAMQSVASPEG